MTIKTRVLRILGLAMVVMLMLGGLMACQDEAGPAEEAGKNIDEAMEDVGDEVEEMGESIQDAAEDN
ncbi:hypothetical protein [Halomonas sp.]|uniref:hypothetical protein n=1 Tax=Halomonas sp. TaxID=1486246 RepID=UPI0035657191